jgi:hypothetical protein
MTTSSTPATSGKANKALVKSYGALVHSTDEGIRSWWREAYAKGLSVRDLDATIEEAKALGEVKSITKNSAKFIRLGVRAFDIKGADSVPVAEIFKVVEVAQRALKVDGALALADLVTDFADFEDKARKADEVRASKKTPRAKAEPVATRGANADAIIAKALADLGELDDVTITDFAQADYLIGALKSALASSKAIAVKHPAGKALAK